MSHRYSMHFDPAALISILPQFVIGGIVAIYFYSTIGKLSPGGITKLNFLVTKGEPVPEFPAKDSPYQMDGKEHRLGIDDLMDAIRGKSLDKPVSTKKEVRNVMNSSPYTRPEIEKHPLIADTQLILLSLEIWILITLLLSPVRSLSFMLPTLSSTGSELLYPILGALLCVAVLTSIISRTDVKRKTMVIMLISAGAVTLGSFYAPSMVWVNNLNLFYHIVVIYTAIVLVCMGIYVLSSYLKGVAAFRASAYASFASYGIITLVLFLNVFSVFP